jgi:hypothetical protein
MLNETTTGVPRENATDGPQKAASRKSELAPALVGSSSTPVTSRRLASRVLGLEPVRDCPPSGTDHVGDRFLTEGALGILITRFVPRGLGCPGGIVSLSFSRCFICNGRDFAGR